MMDIMVIPDTHFSPEGSPARMAWAGRLCAAKDIHMVVHLGDCYDMGSLCEHDKGTFSYSQRNVEEDILAGHKGLETFDNEAGPKVKKVLLGGNHDDARLSRLLEFEPRLRGVLRTSQFHHNGWKWVPYQRPFTAEGVTFCHNMPSGVMNRPIGGENVATSLIKKTLTSCVVGHSHLLDFAERTRADGQKLMGLSAGCFVDPKMPFKYAGLSRNMWWNGIQILYGAKDGAYDLEVWSYDRLKKEFS